MSGGSYDYLYSKEADDLFSSPYRLEEMAERLAGLGWAADAAADAHDLVAIIRTQKVRIDAAMARLRDVFHAVEWWDSCDWSEDQVRAELSKYRGEVAAAPLALRHAWDDPDYLTAYPPHKHPDFAPYWFRRAEHARRAGQPVYVTAQELKTLEDSAPPPPPESEYWQRVGAEPAARAEHSTLSGVPIEVDEEAAASQHARCEARQ